MRVDRRLHELPHIGRIAHGHHHLVLRSRLRDADAGVLGLLLDYLGRQHASFIDVIFDCALHLGFLKRVEVHILETVLIDDYAGIVCLSEAVDGPMLTRRLNYVGGSDLRVALSEALL